MAKILLHGTEAICEGAIRNGCRAFFGYPITPQNEVPEYMSVKMPEIGGVFVQAESEIAAINMVYGAAGSGVRSMTSSSSPGISLKQEGISYIAWRENSLRHRQYHARGSRAGRHSAPRRATIFRRSRAAATAIIASSCSRPRPCRRRATSPISRSICRHKYRVPAMILGDGMIGQLMEPVELPPMRALSDIPEKDWATDGAFGEKRRILNSLLIDPDTLEPHVQAMQKTYAEIAQNETRCETYLCEDAEIVLTAYGTVGRIAKSAVDALRKAGVKAGLIRPITLFPFPAEAYRAAANTAKAFLTVELSLGQMVEDVELAVGGKKPVYFFGRQGGNVMTEEEIVDAAKEALETAEGVRK